MEWGSVRAGPHFIVLIVTNGFEEIYKIIRNNYNFYQLCNLKERFWGQPIINNSKYRQSSCD